MRYNYEASESFVLPKEIQSELERSVNAPINAAALLTDLSRNATLWGSHGFSIALEGNIHLSVSLYWFQDSQYQILFKVGSSAAGFGSEGRDLFRITGHKEAIIRLWENVVIPKKKALTRYA